MAHGKPGFGAVLGALLLVVLAASGCAKKPLPPGPPPPPPTALDLVPQRGELRVCSTGDYRPFTYLDPVSKQWTGIDISMARDMAAALKVKLNLVPTTWATLVTDLGAGQCDLAMGGISVDPQRARQAAFSDPYLVDTKAPVTRCADAARFRTMAQIDQPGVRVVVNPGGTNARYDREHLKRATIVPYPDNNTIFDQILRGQADLMLTDASEGRWQAAQHPGQLCLVSQEHPWTFEPKAYLLPRDDTVFRQWVNTWLRLAIGDGSYQRYTKPWTG
ncbi:MAG TPA: transporter substrate-binding domain-containing protein [Pseudonocardia sp.]|jgi:cyclohexadienyl dehydratase